MVGGALCGVYVGVSVWVGGYTLCGCMCVGCMFGVYISHYAYIQCVLTILLLAYSMIHFSVHVVIMCMCCSG